MSGAGTSRRPHSGAGGGRLRKPHLHLTLLVFAVAAAERATTAAAQFATGLGPPGAGAPSGLTAPPGVSPGSPAATGAPSTLPPPSSGPFGLPSPLAPPTALPQGVTPPASGPPASAVGLPAPGTGITTLQLYDPNAPAVVIQPFATIGETFYDNVFFTANNRKAAAETSLSPGAAVSVDTPRFTGVLSGSASGNLYIPTSSLDQITANLFGQGTGTVVPDRLFVDLASYVTQASTLPGLGFVSPSLLPRTQQTLAFTNTVSPYLRQSYYGLLDGELRYRFASTNFAGNTAVTSTPTPVNSGLATGNLNEGTLTLVTGQDFQRLQSRVIVDGSSFNSNSTSQNTQFSAFDDIEYFIRPNIAALVRGGYQNIRYPFAPSATFTGPTWLAGGRLGSAADYGYLALQYGRVQGVYGFTGSANYQLTPTLLFQAYLVQGISSGIQSFQTSLASSTLSPSGAIVNQSTGLPTTFYNPGVGLNNNPYKQHLYNFGLSDQIGRNNYSLFTYYINAQSLVPPITSPTDSVGAYLSWGRDMRPDLNGYASLGYARTTNVVTVNSPTPVSSTSTVTANIGLNHTFARALTGSVLYTFTYQPNGGAIVNGRTGDIVANSLQFFLTKAF
jgi:hypothetical protein